NLRAGRFRRGQLRDPTARRRSRSGEVRGQLRAARQEVGARATTESFSGAGFGRAPKNRQPGRKDVSLGAGLGNARSEVQLHVEFDTQPTAANLRGPGPPAGIVDAAGAPHEVRPSWHQ